MKKQEEEVEYDGEECVGWKSENVRRVRIKWSVRRRGTKSAVGRSVGWR